MSNTKSPFGAFCNSGDRDSGKPLTPETGTPGNFVTPEALTITPETGTPGSQNNFGGSGSIITNSGDRDSGKPLLTNLTPETGTPGNQ